jgi:hypothetical protein
VDVNVLTDERRRADGEAVWSRRPDAGVKCRAGSKGVREAMVANKHWLTKESTE